MISDEVQVDLEALVARLAVTDDAEARAVILAGAYSPDSVGDLAERLKVEAYHARLHDPTLSLRWCDDIKALGRSADEPTVVALGHMAAGLALLSQDRLHDSLAVFDEASTLFRAHGDEVGWARTQIGRTAPCAMLGRFDEALERAREAHNILEAAGDTLRLAAIDDNLAMLLEHMNRPAEALAYNEQAMVAYRTAGAREDALHSLHNHALLLWRLGRARESIASYTEAREAIARSTHASTRRAKTCTSAPPILRWDATLRPCSFCRLRAAIFSLWNRGTWPHGQAYPSPSAWCAWAASTTLSTARH